jgi:hypothetical protein
MQIDIDEQRAIPWLIDAFRASGIRIRIFGSPLRVNLQVCLMSDYLSIFFEVVSLKTKVLRSILRKDKASLLELLATLHKEQLLPATIIEDLVSDAVMNHVITRADAADCGFIFCVVRFQ